MHQSEIGYQSNSPLSARAPRKRRAISGSAARVAGSASKQGAYPYLHPRVGALASSGIPLKSKLHTIRSSFVYQKAQ